MSALGRNQLAIRMQNAQIQLVALIVPVTKTTMEMAISVRKVNVMMQTVRRIKLVFRRQLLIVNASKDSL